MCEEDIIFQDKYFAVIYKHIGDDSQDFFKEFFLNKKYAEAVNRLDKPVSGLLIVAFSADIHEKFNVLFRTKQVKKEYWAICKKKENIVSDKMETIGKNNLIKLEDFLYFNRKTQKAVISREKKTAKFKHAELVFELAGSGDNYDFLRVFPLTGRTHQIRAQLSNYAMPIKGDLKYGFKRSERSGGIRLHSYSVEFPHPINGETVKFTALPRNPDALWQACLDACAELEN